MSGMYSAWSLGGGEIDVGVTWMKALAAQMVLSILLQDLRDVVGDTATGRVTTTPMMLGYPYSTSNISYLLDDDDDADLHRPVGMLLPRLYHLHTQYLQS